MKKLCLLVASIGVLYVPASADTVNLHRSKSPAPVASRIIPEQPVHPSMAGNVGFGNALEQALAQRNGSVMDPSGRFSVQVAPDGMGQVIRLVPVKGGGQPREWKLASGAGDLVLSATIAEVMTATGQEVPTQLSSTLTVQPLVGTLKN